LGNSGSSSGRRSLPTFEACSIEVEVDVVANLDRKELLGLGERDEGAVGDGGVGELAVAGAEQLGEASAQPRPGRAPEL
jgi:hypothetical protein